MSTFLGAMQDKKPLQIMCFLLDFGASSVTDHRLLPGRGLCWRGWDGSFGWRSHSPCCIYGTGYCRGLNNFEYYGPVFLM